jgi:hypothetical protein
MKNKRTASKKDFLLQLEPLASRLKVWRQTRPRGQRIPKELWQAATEQARIHGLNVTAKVLKLDYYDLKRRVGPPQTKRKPAPAQAAFVELTPSAWTGGTNGHGTVELIKPSGARLTIHFSNPSAQDLLPLVRTFLSQRS